MVELLRFLSRFHLEFSARNSGGSGQSGRIIEAIRLCPDDYVDYDDYDDYYGGEDAITDKTCRHFEQL